MAKPAAAELVAAEPVAEIVPLACRSCDHFAAPTSDREKVEKVGGVWKGDCVLQPTVLKKSPDDRCGQHSALVAARRDVDAAALGAAIGSALEAALGGVDRR